MTAQVEQHWESDEMDITTDNPQKTVAIGDVPAVERASLMGIPVELRLMILRSLFSKVKWDRPYVAVELRGCNAAANRSDFTTNVFTPLRHGVISHSTPEKLAVLLTNRQIYAEAVGMVYRKSSASVTVCHDKALDDNDKCVRRISEWLPGKHVYQLHIRLIMAPVKRKHSTIQRTQALVNAMNQWNSLRHVSIFIKPCLFTKMPAYVNELIAILAGIRMSATVLSLDVQFWTKDQSFDQFGVSKYLISTIKSETRKSLRRAKNRRLGK